MSNTVSKNSDRTFGMGSAIKYLEDHYNVCRTGWNGKGMYIYLVPAEESSHHSYLALRTADGSTVPWTASQSDILAKDWMIAPMGVRVESEGDKKDVKLEDPRHHRFIDRHIEDNGNTLSETDIHKQLDCIARNQDQEPVFNFMAASLFVEEKGLPVQCTIDGVTTTLTPELVASKRWQLVEERRVVSKEDIDKIVKESNIKFQHFDNKLTIAVLTLPSGFKLTGESGCADPAKFDKALGERYSLEKAVDRLWEMENYALAAELYKEGLNK